MDIPPPHTHIHQSWYGIFQDDDDVLTASGRSGVGADAVSHPGHSMSL